MRQLREWSIVDIVYPCYVRSKPRIRGLSEKFTGSGSIFSISIDLFVILVSFGVVLGVILGAKGRPKWLQKLIKKISVFWIALGSALVRQRAGRGS